jgi:hypothetical protein
LGFAIERAEQRRALDFALQPRRPIAGRSQLRIEIGEPCFLREARPPD